MQVLGLMVSSIKEQVHVFPVLLHSSTPLSPLLPLALVTLPQAASGLYLPSSPLALGGVFQILTLFNGCGPLERPLLPNIVLELWTILLSL